jgi:UDP-glucose 4-epimerase
VKNKKILVTGGAGFIGSNLVKYLLHKNEVHVLDNYLTGSTNNHESGANYIDGNCNEILEIFSDISFDYIFHFGEYSRVEQSLNEPYFVFNNNGSIINIIKYCELNSTKLIYSCSSTIFNDIDNNSTSLSPYTASKSMNLKLIKDMCDWRNIDNSIVYFYNVYGPNEISVGKYATVVAKFIELKRNGNTTAPVSLPGTQTRNFTHVNDLIDGIILAAKFGSGDGYGIGSDEAFSILDFCKMVELEPIFYKSSISNRMSSPLNTKNIKDLGWAPKHDLISYIKEMDL